MLKILVKKQLFELFSSIFFNRKNGKKRNAGGVVGIIALFVALTVMMMIIFSGLSALMADALLTPGFMTGNSTNWLYFALMALMSIFFGTFGSVFSTYSSLYIAKDNEMLIAMPIKSSTILMSRIIGVFVLGFAYSMIIWIPATFIYWTRVLPTVTGIIFPILLNIFISLTVTVLTCLLGFLVAYISSKMKNKNVVAAILSVIFFCVYYFLCFRLNSVIQALMMNADKVGNAVKGWLWPVYQLGRAATGEADSMIIYALITIAIFALCYYIMSKTFTSIVTSRKGGKKAVYVEKKYKNAGVGGALLAKETKRFFASTTYMLNAGLGVPMIIIVTVLAVVKRSTITEFFEGVAEEAPVLMDAFPIIVVGLVLLMMSMDAVSASSVSLEGKNYWITRSLPIDTWEILHAKQNLHVRINLLPTVACTFVLGIAFEFSIYLTIIMAALSGAFIWFAANLGLVLNIKNPNLHWTTEAAPVKQSLAVFISLFGGWLICLVFMALGVFSLKFMENYVYIIASIVFFIILVLFTNFWLKKKGTKLYEEIV